MSSWLLRSGPGISRRSVVPPSRRRACGHASRCPGARAAVSGSQSSGRVTIVRAGSSSVQPSSSSGAPSTQCWPQTKCAGSPPTFVQLRPRVLDTQRPLELERRLAAARRESDFAVRKDLVLPRQRRHLAVKRDPPAAIRARLVHAREQLLPPAGVVPHVLVVAAALERRRARRPEPPTCAAARGS